MRIGVEAGAAAKRARHRDARLPGSTVEQWLAVAANQAMDRLRAEPGAQRADRVRERAEDALEAMPLDGRGGREPDAGDVHERAIPHPAEIEQSSLAALNRQPARRSEIEWDVERPGEVVRGPSRDDGEWHASAAGGLGGGADRAVAAGDHDPLGSQSNRSVTLIQPEVAHLGAAFAQHPPGLGRGAPAGLRVGE